MHLFYPNVQAYSDGKQTKKFVIVP